jgi:hypothetical protein
LRSVLLRLRKVHVQIFIEELNENGGKLAIIQEMELSAKRMDKFLWVLFAFFES